MVEVVRNLLNQLFSVLGSVPIPNSIRRKLIYLHELIIGWVEKMLKITNFILNSFWPVRNDNERRNSCNECATHLTSFQNTHRLRVFKKMLETDTFVKGFLEYDECCLLADNYLIAMVVIYFIRSDLRLAFYDAEHFFSALYLAHEMEEDLEELKGMIVPWFPAPNWEKRLALNEIKFFMWENMNLDCLVRRNECEWVMNETQDWSVWKRTRHMRHHTCSSIRSHRLKNCCACILQKSLRLDGKDCSAEDDIPLQTSDWEIDSNFSP